MIFPLYSAVERESGVPCPVLGSCARESWAGGPNVCRAQDIQGDPDQLPSLHQRRPKAWRQASLLSAGSWWVVREKTELTPSQRGQRKKGRQCGHCSRGNSSQVKGKKNLQWREVNLRTRELVGHPQPWRYSELPGKKKGHGQAQDVFECKWLGTASIHLHTGAQKSFMYAWEERVDF